MCFCALFPLPINLQILERFSITCDFLQHYNELRLKKDKHIVKHNY